MYSAVLPAVIRILFPANFLLLCPIDCLEHTEEVHCAAISLAFPCSIRGSRNSTPFALSLLIFSCMILLEYIASCIAGQITIGIPDPSATVRTEVTTVSSIPLAEFSKCISGTRVNYNHIGSISITQ